MDIDDIRVIAGPSLKGLCEGYGEATVRKALYEGARATALKRTVLHATEAGFPVYRRIGYRKVARLCPTGRS